MLTQIKILTKLELCNIYGLNVLRFTKDKKAKKKAIGLLSVCLILLIMLVFYVSGLTYGLIFLGLEEMVPAYLITVSSLLIFVFGMLKAGSVIFRKEGYDMLCALPVTTAAVVSSRLLRMYLENLLAALAVLLPGAVVYAWKLRPGTGVYLTGFLGLWAVPLIPMAGSILIGALITGISSRMRHKSLAAAGLSILAVLAVLYGSSRLSAVDDSIDPEMLRELSAVILKLLEKVYPLAVWLGTATVHGDLLQGLLGIILSLAIFTAVAAGVILCFQKICRSLYSSSAKHNYKMGKLKTNAVLISLCKREFKRYFSSSIYVTNTIIGPIMGCILSGALLAAGTESVEKFLPLPIDIVALIPFAIASVFCMMTTTSTSISMEGKNWWIVKSLPLSVKNILDAKILMNLLLMLPFYLLSELLLVLALKPDVWEFLWLVLIPAAMILFSCVYGITINLHFPVLEWESEVSVVKQSASAVLGGMGGFVLAILCAIGTALIPSAYAGFLKAGICASILLATVLLYWKNNGYNICSLPAD